MTMPMLFQTGVEPDPMIWLGVIGAVTLLFMFFLVFIVKQYKRCPSNQILVLYGKVGVDKAAQCIHGGGKFVVPLLQDYAYLSLEPMVIEIPLQGALSQNNIRVDVPSTFTVIDLFIVRVKVFSLDTSANDVSDPSNAKDDLSAGISIPSTVRGSSLWAYPDPRRFIS